jgi:hypothetical protein
MKMPFLLHPANQACAYRISKKFRQGLMALIERFVLKGAAVRHRRSTSFQSFRAISFNQFIMPICAVDVRRSNFSQLSARAMMGSSFSG